MTSRSTSEVGTIGLHDHTGSNNHSCVFTHPCPSSYGHGFSNIASLAQSYRAAQRFTHWMCGFRANWQRGKRARTTYTWRWASGWMFHATPNCLHAIGVIVHHSKWANLPFLLKVMLGAVLSTKYAYTKKSCAVFFAQWLCMLGDVKQMSMIPRSCVYRYTDRLMACTWKQWIMSLKFWRQRSCNRVRRRGGVSYNTSLVSVAPLGCCRECGFHSPRPK